MSLPEPWLRGSLTEVPVIARALLHSLEMAREDLLRWCEPLEDEQFNAQRASVPSVAFQVQHIIGSLDRLLTYAEGRELDHKQLASLQTEHRPARRAELLRLMLSELRRAEQRVRELASLDMNAARWVGRKRLPTTLGGLLVHIAEHTQRHVGQAITTCKMVTEVREEKA